MRILSEREAATLGSSWKEYLTIRNIGPGRAKLEICRYEVLAEWYAREDDEGNEIPLPGVYNGKKVVGVEDGYLVGGKLEASDSHWFEVNDTSMGDAVRWIKSEKFKVDQTIEVVLRGCL